MGFINLAEKTINAKLVYYGVGLGGKTTSLKVVHGIMCPRDEVKLVSINTEQDSTLLFDFLPIDLGQVEGFKIRVQGFTVPGQQKYVVMRKYVLQGADAVVLVVDSQKALVEDNLQSIEDLKTNLEANGLDWETIPLVIQYNKRDLPDLVPAAELDALFRFREVPTFETIAPDGVGVFEAFRDVVGWMVEEKVRQYGLGKGEIDAADVAEEARARLEQLRTANDEEEAAGGEGLVSVAVSERAKASLDTVTLDQPTVDVGEANRTTDTPDAEPVGDAAPVEVVAAPKLSLARAAEPVTPTALTREEIADVSDLCSEDSSSMSEAATGLLGQAISSNLELAELYSELAEYKSLLEKKNRELVEVNQLISHDLKKPLTVFKTVISLMQSGRLGALSESQTDAIHNCAESVKYMEDLISDILESSRLDYDGVEFDFVDVDMTLLVGSIVRRLRYHVEDAGVRLRVEPLPIIRGDERALEKVFMNLIGNAVSYRDTSEDISWVRVSADEVDGDWVFHIRDNGIGIPQASQKTIWQKFQRGANTAGISGTGLGLYIVQQMIRGHGGDIRVESEVGEGTTFHIRVPQVPEQPDHSPVA